ncbi:LysR family transcriptional regulator [Cupriavidus sp. UYPR2.512]|uniref:LysR family transcriptional regulator n=1 Tax=Cupriavidus sp. UYPR2.512 TaxID=1080187 RepID=UPI00038213EF|nr:LysR family transcriptional regulator [Cupriavidus sp. UYPR2.512]UIF91563.1 LysR family transcriptional regulator [Cupriavidus necator]
MDTIRAMQIFVRAVELGSLSAVAREQQSTQPTISKAVAALEKDMGVRLLERSTTSLSPTEAGRRFYERARRMLDEYGEAVSDARGMSGHPAGRVRVSAPASFGVLRLNALVLAFQQRYPEVEVELRFDDRFVDLVEEGVDVAVRLGASLPPNVVARRIAVSPRLLVASPDYLARHPRIRQPADLARHQILRFTWLAAGDKIVLDGPGGQALVSAPGRYRVNNSLAMRESFLAGAGFGMTPAWLVQDLLDSGALQRVLPRWSGPAQEAFLVYPSRRYLPARVRVLLEYLAQAMAGLPGLIPV